MAKKEERFVKIWSEGAFGSNEIWVDLRTICGMPPAMLVV